MIKNKILFTALFAFTTNLFIQTSFPIQKNTSTPKTTPKPINTVPKKFNLNTELKKQLILKALAKDESDDIALQQISYLITSITMSGATTALLNYDKIVPILKQLKNKNKEPANTSSFFGIQISNQTADLTPDLIKISAQFTLFSLIYYIVLNVLFHYIGKEDNSEEKVLRLVTILDQLDN